MDTSSVPGLELIQIADAVYRENQLTVTRLLRRWRKQFKKAGRSKYGYEHDIRAMIDRKTGAISLERWTEVVEDIEDDATQMSVDEGKKYQIELGGIFT